MMQYWNSCRATALASAALVFLWALAPAAARAGMPLPLQVVGPVSSVEGTTAVRINGTTYLIAPNSAAAQEIHNVTAGETIGLVLNGPTGSATSEVVYITHNATGRAGR
ncbi:MAG TPA: hypothetical protein VN660_03650 [Steroidobacteraceae bacterium]|nr:hypothetical protein [Steroidobacteraceae bacterium]